MPGERLDFIRVAVGAAVRESTSHSGVVDSIKGGVDAAVEDDGGDGGPPDKAEGADEGVGAGWNCGIGFCEDSLDCGELSRHSYGCDDLEYDPGCFAGVGSQGGEIATCDSENDKSDPVKRLVFARFGH